MGTKPQLYPCMYSRTGLETAASTNLSLTPLLVSSTQLSLRLLVEQILAQGRAFILAAEAAAPLELGD